MWIRSVSIKNFRTLANIELSFNPKVNVIVGPNAVGKSTILEAIRFVKAICAPRTLNETVQVLLSLRAATPHRPQEIIPAGITRHPERPVEIECSFQLTEDELLILRENKSRISTQLTQSRFGQGNAPAAFVAFMASPVGKTRLHETENEVEEGIRKLSGDSICQLSVKIDFVTNRMEPGAPIHSAFFQFLEGRLPPNHASFSYFPADRALPPGEQPIQIGVQDAAQQLETYNSQPHTKYTRTKNSIFNSVIMSEAERSAQLEEFQAIFDALLKNRKIVGPRVNEFGQLSIDIQDSDTGAIFDIDSMSSGEKNLVLTWLLIGRSMPGGGIVLLDEPELHLNPAVCKHILPFLVENYVTPRTLQAIICTHSPAILAGSFNRAECSLYHLRKGDSVTRVRPQDREELTEALRLLGTSEVEGLLYEGTVFVEGEHDVELLDEGFGDLLRRYMLKDLGGRREVEKQIVTLQKAEEAGSPLSPRYFIFDRDRTPTDLKQSGAVRFVQWNRYCLENYLIDVDIIADLLKGHEIDGQKIINVGQVENLLQSLAHEQLEEFAIREVYQSYGYKDPGLRVEDVEAKDVRTATDALFKRIEDTQASIGNLRADDWKQRFLTDVSAKRDELQKIWDKRWITECDGKKLFWALQRRIKLGMHILTFKKNVISRMRQAGSEGWTEMHGKLFTLISTA